MRLLDRYLLRELLVPLGYCLCGFLILWIFSELFTQLGEFQRKKLVPADIAEYYLLKTPQFLAIGLPVALLLALLYSLSNHSRHNEITAIRAAGVSLWRMCLPYLVVGLMASALLFALNELWAPDGEDAAEQILERRQPRPPGDPGVRRIAHFGFTNGREGRIWQIELYNSESGEMTRPQIRWTLTDGSSRWLSAERAVWTNE